jgi:hypothetical protein
MGVLQTPALATWLRRLEKTTPASYILILPRLLDGVKSPEEGRGKINGQEGPSLGVDYFGGWDFPPQRAGRPPDVPVGGGRERTLSSRIGRRLTLMGSNVFIALGILGVIASMTASVLWGIPVLFASIALLGIFYRITWPMYGACGGDYFRKDVMGTVIWSLPFLCRG